MALRQVHATGHPGGLRSRLVTVDGPVVHEPVRGAHFPQSVLALRGLDQLRLFLTGRALPPPITDWLLTPQGVATGGVLAILADGPLGCAIQTTLPAGTGYTTSELSLNLVRPVPRTGELIARGRIVHTGRQLALSEVFITDHAGRLIAHGTSRCVIFPPVEVPDGTPEFPEVTEPDDGWVPPYRRQAPGTLLDQEIFATRDGLDIMRAHIARELPSPPIGFLLGTRPTAASEGTCTFSLPATGWLTSPLGLVEGGVTAALADLALGGAVQTTVPAGAAFAPTDLRVQFLRPVPPDGRTVTANGTVVHRGRGVAVARADVVNADGKLVALATGSAVILPGRRADLTDTPGLG